MLSPMSQEKSLDGEDDRSPVHGGTEEAEDEAVPTAPADPNDPPVDPEEPVNPA
jgi:hypothetical protein